MKRYPFLKNDMKGGRGGLRAKLTFKLTSYVKS